MVADKCGWTVRARFIGIVVVNVFQKFDGFINVALFLNMEVLNRTGRLFAVRWFHLTMWGTFGAQSEPHCVSSVFTFSCKICVLSFQTLWRCLPDSYKTTTMLSFFWKIVAKNEATINQSAIEVQRCVCTVNVLVFLHPNPCEVEKKTLGVSPVCI